MESAVAALLRSTCGDYFAEGAITSHAVTIELWSGKAYLYNIALNPTIFQRLGVPLRVTSGFVGMLCVELPWFGLRSKPIAVSLSGVILEVTPGHGAEPDEKTEEDVDSSIDSKVNRTQEKPPQQPTDSYRESSEEGHPGSNNNDQSLKGKILSFVRNMVEESALNLRIELHDITLRYRDIFLPGSSSKPKRFGLCLHLESITLKTIEQGNMKSALGQKDNNTSKLHSESEGPQQQFFYHRSEVQFCKHLAISGIEVYSEGDFNEGYTKHPILHPISISLQLEAALPTYGELWPKSVKVKIDVHAVSDSAICTDIRLSDIAKFSVMAQTFSDNENFDLKDAGNVEVDGSSVINTDRCHCGDESQAGTTDYAPNSKVEAFDKNRLNKHSARTDEKLVNQSAVSFVVAAIIAPVHAKVDQIGVIDIGPTTIKGWSTSKPGNTKVDARISYAALLYFVGYCLPKDKRAIVLELSNIAASVGSPGTPGKECSFTEASPISVTLQEVYCDILSQNDALSESSLYPIARNGCPVVHWNDLCVQIVPSDCRERLYRPIIDRSSTFEATDNPCPVKRILQVLPTLKVIVGIGSRLGICMSKSEVELICKCIVGEDDGNMTTTNVNTENMMVDEDTLSSPNQSFESEEAAPAPTQTAHLVSTSGSTLHLEINAPALTIDILPRERPAANLGNVEYLDEKGLRIGIRLPHISLTSTHFSILDVGIEFEELTFGHVASLSQVGQALRISSPRSSGKATSNIRVLLLPQCIHETGDKSLLCGNYIGIEVVAGAFEVNYQTTEMFGSFKLITDTILKTLLQEKNIESSNKPVSSHIDLLGNDLNLRDTRKSFGMRISTEKVSIHLFSDCKKAVAELIACDTVTGMVITDAGSMKLSGTIGGLELKDSTEAGRFHSKVISNFEDHDSEMNVINWTVDILQPLFAFQMRLRGSGVHLHYLNRFVLEIVEYIKQQFIPSFSAFSLGNNTEVMDQIDDVVSQQKITDAGQSPIHDPNGDGKTVIEVFLVDSVAEIGMNSEENSDYLILAFDKLQLWWACEMSDPPGEFLEAGYLPGLIFESTSAGTFSYFDDLNPNAGHTPYRCEARRKAHDLDGNLENDSDLDCDATSEDDPEFVDAEEYIQNFKNEKTLPGLLCFKISGVALSTMKCEDMMGSNIMLECSVLLSDDELISVTVDIPRLPLHMNEQQYGAILGMIYGNFAELPCVIPPKLPDKCEKCDGHHFDTLQCFEPWLTVSINIDDAPVTIMDTVPDESRNSIDGSLYTRHDRPIAKINFGGLVYEMANLNCETGENFIYAMDLGIIDLEPSAKSRFRGVLSPRHTNPQKGVHTNSTAIRASDDVARLEELQEHDGIAKTLEIRYDGSPQFTFKSIATWTTSVMNIDINRSCIVGYGGVLSFLTSFFYNPISDPAYIPEMWLNPPQPKIDEGMDLRVVTKDCLICLVEQIEVEHPRAMVLHSDIEYSQSWRGDVIVGPGLSQLGLTLMQHALFFAHLPIVGQNNLGMSVLKPFCIKLSNGYSVSNPTLAKSKYVGEDHKNQQSMSDNFIPYTGQSIIEVEVDRIYCEVSFRDCQLLLESVSTLIASFFSDIVAVDSADDGSTKIVANQAPLGPDTPRGRSRASLTLSDNDFIGDLEISVPASDTAESNQESFTDLADIHHDNTLQSGIGKYTGEAEHETPVNNEKVEGKIGAIRLVLMHNMLGVPLFDLRLSKSSLEILRHNSTMNGGANIELAFNYFNNMVHAWEPAVEPVNIALKIQSDSYDRPCYQVDCFSGIHVNFTTALVRLLTQPSLKQDVVTSEIAAMKPYLVKNLSGLDCVILCGNRLYHVENGSEVGLGFSRRKMLGEDYKIGDEISKVEEGIGLSFPANNCETARQFSLNTISKFSIPMVAMGTGIISSLLPKISLESVEGESSPHTEALNVLPQDVFKYSPLQQTRATNVIGETTLDNDGRKVMVIKSAIEVTNICEAPVTLLASGIYGDYEVNVGPRDTTYIPVRICEKNVRLSVRPNEDFNFTEIDLLQKNRVARVITECNISSSTKPALLSKRSARYAHQDPSATFSNAALENRTSYCVDIVTSFISNQMRLHDAGVAKSMDKLNGGIIQRAVKIGPLFLLQNLNGTATFYKITGEHKEVFAEGLLEPGQQIPLHKLSMKGNIYIALLVPNYAWSKRQQIYFGKLGHKDRSSVMEAIMKGLPFVASEKIRNPSDSKSVKTVSPPSLTLQIEVKDQKIIFYSPVWIKNCSRLPLHYRCGSISPQQILRGSNNNSYFVHQSNQMQQLQKGSLSTLKESKQPIDSNEAGGRSLDKYSSNKFSQTIFKVTPASNRQSCILMTIPVKKYARVLSKKLTDNTLSSDSTLLRSCEDAVAHNNESIEPISQSESKKMVDRSDSLGNDVAQQHGNKGKDYVEVTCTYMDLFEALRKRCHMGSSSKQDNYIFKERHSGKILPMSAPIPHTQSQISIVLEHVWETSVLLNQHSNQSPSQLPTEVFQDWPEYLSVTEGESGKLLPGSRKRKPQDNIQIQTNSSQWSNTVHIRDGLAGAISIKSKDLHARVPVYKRELNTNKKSNQRGDQKNEGVNENISSKALKKLGDMSQTLSSQVATFEFSLSVSSAPGIFYRTRILRIYPRYSLVNRTPRIILLRQFIAHDDTDFQNASEDASLEPDTLMNFQWPHNNRRHSLQFMFGGGILGQTWEWSGELNIDMIGEHAIVLRRQGHGVRAKYVLRVSVKLTDFSSLVVTFLPESRRYPPYRIKNDTHLQLRVSQSKIPISFWEPLGPFKTIPFAWDQPFVPDPNLRIEFPTASGKSKKKDFSLSKNRNFKAFEISNYSKKKDSSSLFIAVSIAPDGPTKVITIREKVNGRKKSIDILQSRIREQLSKKLELASKGAAVVRDAVVRDVQAKGNKISQLRDATKRKAQRFQQRMKRKISSGGQEKGKPLVNNEIKVSRPSQSKMLFARIARKSILSSRAVARKRASSSLAEISEALDSAEKSPHDHDEFFHVDRMSVSGDKIQEDSNFRVERSASMSTIASVVEAHDDFPTLEHEYEREGNDGWKLTVSISLVSLSLIDREWGPPAEIMYFTLSEIHATLQMLAGKRFQTSVSARSMQLDNQLRHCEYPVVLIVESEESGYDNKKEDVEKTLSMKQSSASLGRNHGFECRSCKSFSNGNHNSSPSLHACFVQNKDHEDLLYIDSMSIYIAPLSISLDKGLIVRVLKMLTPLFGHPSEEEVREVSDILRAEEGAGEGLIAPLDIEQRIFSESEESKLFCDLFNISKINLRISFGGSTISEEDHDHDDLSKSAELGKEERHTGVIWQSSSSYFSDRQNYSPVNLLTSMDGLDGYDSSDDESSISKEDKSRIKMIDSSTDNSIKTKSSFSRLSASSFFKSFYRKHYGRESVSVENIDPPEDVDKLDIEVADHDVIKSTETESSTINSLIHAIARVPRFENTSINISQICLEQHIGTSSTLISTTSKQVLSELIRQLLQIATVRAPVRFASGVKDFFARPVEGLREDGTRGLVRGLKNSSREAASGAANIFSTVTGVAARTVELATLDSDFNRVTSSQEAKGLLTSMKKGSHQVGRGFYQGITGFVLQPLKAARLGHERDGIRGATKGFLSGAVKGIVGVPLKPIAGILRGVTTVSQGAKVSVDRAAVHHTNAIWAKLDKSIWRRRKRLPRVLPPSGIPVYDNAAEDASLAQELLHYIPDWAGLPVEIALLYDDDAVEIGKQNRTGELPNSSVGASPLPSDGARADENAVNFLILCTGAMLKIHALKSRMKHPKVCWAIRLSNVIDVEIQKEKNQFLKFTCASTRAGVLEKLGKNTRRWQKRYIR